MPDFGFVGPSYVAKSIYQDDQECINWFPENDPFRKERGVIALYPTPGLVQQIGQTSNPAGGAPIASPLGSLGCRGLRTLPGGTGLLAIYGAQLYLIDTSYNVTKTSLTLLTNNGPVSISDNGVSAYICDGFNRYYYTWGTNSGALIADGGFTSGGIVEMLDGFLIYTNPGTNQFGCTSANAVTSGALSFGTKFSSPDNVQAVIAVNRDLYVVGEKTTEVYQDAGGFPFPFSIIAGTSMQHGTQAPYSIARLGEGFAMLAQDTRGDATVVVVAGYRPTRISTFAVEQAINGYAYTADAIGMTHQWNGHEFYMLTFPTADVTWVYDLATQLWHKRAYRDANNVWHRHRAAAMAFFNGVVVVGDYQSGTLYTFSDTTYTDAGQTIVRLRRAPHLTEDLQRVYHHDLQLQFQPGVGLQTGKGVDPQAMLRWSNDGGSTWSSEHWTSVGKVGKYKNRAIWRRLGQARDRIYETQVSDPVNMSLISANLNATGGAA